MITQISVFVENKTGALAEITRSIAQEKINIRALSIADTSEYGVLRMIVSNHDAALVALAKHGFLIKATPVVAVRMTDEEGALCQIIEKLAEAGENVEYLYAFNHASSNSAYVVLRVQDCARAEEVLAKNGFSMLSQNDVAVV